MKNISIKILVYFLFMFLTIGTFSSAANHQSIEKHVNTSMENCQLKYEYYKNSKLQ